MKDSFNSKTERPPMLWPWWGSLLLLGALFFYFLKVRGPDDPWTTGHMLLVAKSYVQAGFKTPYLAPMEDPFGPAAGWSPYVGQLPLPFMAWAVFMKFTGFTWEMARTLACVFTALTGLATTLIAWRVTRDRVATAFSLAAFCGNPLVLLYAGFAWHDIVALPWVLMLILLFPQWAAGGTTRSWMLYVLLTVVGGAIGWWCYLAPVACGLSLALADRERLRKCWRRLAVLIGLMAIIGIAMLTVYARVQQLHHPNGWLDSPQGSDLAGKFLTRSALGNPQQAVSGAIHWAWNIIQSAAAFSVAALLVVVVSRRQSEADGAQSQPTGDWSRFHFHAVWIYPVLWVATTPQGCGHTFAALHAIPFVAVLMGTVARAATASRSVRPLKRAFVVLMCAMVAAPTTLIAVRNSMQGKGPYPGSQRWRHAERYAALQEDIRKLTNPDSLVVMGFDERGYWWSTQRPVVALTRLSDVQSLPHVLVLPVGERAERLAPYRPLWEGRYTVAREQRFTDARSSDYDYVILVPKSQP